MTSAMITISVVISMAKSAHSAMRKVRLQRYMMYNLMIRIPGYRAS